MENTNNGVPTDNGQLMDRSEMARAIYENMTLYPTKVVHLGKNDVVEVSDDNCITLYNPVSARCRDWVRFKVANPELIKELVEIVENLPFMWGSAKFLKPRGKGWPINVLLQVDSLQTATHIVNLLMDNGGRAAYQGREDDQVIRKEITVSAMGYSLAKTAVLSAKHLNPEPTKGNWDNFMYARFHRLMDAGIADIRTAIAINRRFDDIQEE